MKITLCAKSQILLLSTNVTFRVIASSSAAGSHVDLLPEVDVTPFDNTISYVPLVVIDVQTALLLAGQDIDFDYGTGEFIISNRKNE